MKDLYQLFIEELKEIYSAESQSFKLFPKVMQAVKSMKLKDYLRQCIEDTKNQIVRLEKIASELGETFEKAECDAIEGFTKEWERLQQFHYQEDVRDAAVICFLQKLKHFEIASYGCLRTFAKHLKKDKFAVLLKHSILEEGKADKKLTEIAEGTLFSNGVNEQAKNCV